MSDDQSFLSVQYMCALDNLEPSNYTQIPNIVDYLTYDELDEKTGEIVVKRLSVYAIQLYRVIRNVAGQENTTWRNTENLAELANMSMGQVAKCKKELLQKFHQLDGNTLIEIVERKKTNWDNAGHKVNGIVYHQIKVRNIWGFNRAFFILKKAAKEATSLSESAGGAPSPQKSALEEAPSLSERNKKQSSKTPLYKEQHPTANADSACSLNSEGSFVSSSENQTADEKTTWFNSLLRIGCNVLTATKIIETYTINEIREAALYVGSQMKKKTEKNEKCPSPIGYLQRTLENKWWVKKTC